MYIVDTLSKSLNDNGTERRYEYRVIKSNFLVRDFDEGEIEAYGIEVERKDLQSGKVFNLERDIITNVSPQINKVQALAEFLCKNSVSPINFVEILGEYVDEYVSDFDDAIQNKLLVNSL